MNQSIEKSALPQIDARDVAVLSAMWVAARRAESAQSPGERDELLALFERACKQRKLHVPTVYALFSHWYTSTGH